MLPLALLPLEQRKDNAAPEDWPEDFDHENGNYDCICHDCGLHFMGHKRRIICRSCASDNCTKPDNETTNREK